MEAISELQIYIDLARRSDSYEDLRSATEAFIRALGFDYFALLHHVDQDHPQKNVVRLGNYPLAWREVVHERKYFGDDPILMACQHCVTGFRWTDVETMIEMTPRQREIWAASADAGLGDGYTVPIRIPGEAEASCNFGVLGSRPAPVHSFPSAHYVGCFAFEQARRLSLKDAPRPATPRLTTRQLDCLVLAGRGKSASVSSQLLGISTETVYEHLGEAKRRYGVATVQQLLVKALHDNQIVFADVL